MFSETFILPPELLKAMKEKRAAKKKRAGAKVSARKTTRRPARQR